MIPATIPAFIDEESNSKFILSEERLDILYKDPKKAKFSIVKKYKGSELVGLKYQPLFDYFSNVSSHIIFIRRV